MEAIILAGGFGKRLHSKVRDVPKPLVKKLKVMKIENSSLMTFIKTHGLNVANCTAE